MKKLIPYFLFALVGCQQANSQQEKPNIILIMADDMGFSDLGCYGGEVKTPNIDQLAAGGIRYKQFYNAARCCPTRAALMTGLYPHQAGMGWMAAADLGRPAYQGGLNNNCVTIAEALKPAGYATAMVGKWHLTQERQIDGYVTDTWPKQRGFDRYFGIVPGGGNYFTPVLYSNNERYKAPDNFYLTHAITDTGVRYIDEHFTSDKKDPLFMYVAYTAPHWPLHALQADIDKYKGYYKKGWDKLREERLARQKEIGLFNSNAQLSERDPVVPAWDELSAAEQEEMAMRMAIYAAQIDAMDQGVGKIVAKLKEKGQLDNTIIFFLSDNGACAEYISSGKSKAVDGTEDTFESYRINWANAGSTPFREYKHYTHEGGIATPFIVHWPKGIDASLKGSFVNEYGHLTDVMATCVDQAKADYPTSVRGEKIHPMQGKSLTPHFSGKTNNRGVIFWEHEANIAVRDGKWKLVAKTEQDSEFDPAKLELYDMDSDPVEAQNLASLHPARRDSMFAAWKSWAGSIDVFPMDTREYNIRAQEYRRTINGDFNVNLGGWAVRKQPAVKGFITVDSTGKLTGKNAALIQVEQPGSKPAQLNMGWNFRANKGEKFLVEISFVSEKPAEFILRLEENNDDHTKLMDQVIQSKPGKQTVSFTSSAVPEKDQYQLVLYFGTTEAGSKIWIDDVKLVPVSEN